MPSGDVIRRAGGISRSLVTYYGPVWRRGRMEAFYRRFLRAGDLAFDIGAHVGNRVRVFRRIGARVIAVEPQPDFVAVLQLLYGRDPDVVIEASGVAAGSGEGKLYLSTRTPTVSTFADSWIDDVQTDRRFQRIRWDTVISVPLVSLDELISRHGEPQFCKIDVEGFEHEVLQGLSEPIAALSFEYIPVAIDRATACLERISSLGDYRYRHSRVETHRWADHGWMEPETMIELLSTLPADDRSGDVYAVRTDRLSAANDLERREDR
jgi:FkbM family methyltransferase